jgi:hypothetical protein
MNLLDEIKATPPLDNNVKQVLKLTSVVHLHEAVLKVSNQENISRPKAHKIIMEEMKRIGVDCRHQSWPSIVANISWRGVK